MVKNKKLIYGILVVVVLVILGISLFVLNRPTSCKEKAKLLVESIQRNKMEQARALTPEVISCGDKIINELTPLFNYEEDVQEYSIAIFASIGTQKSVKAVIDKFGNTEDPRRIDVIGETFKLIPNGDPAEALIDCLTEAKSLSMVCHETLIRISDAKVIQSLINKIRKIDPTGTLESSSDIILQIKPYSMVLSQLKKSKELEKALNENRDHEVIKVCIETALGIR